MSAIPGAPRRDVADDESGSESSDLAAELMFDYLSGAAWKQLLCGFVGFIGFVRAYMALIDTVT